MLELVSIGPFSWLSGAPHGPARIFDVAEARACGVYLFTFPTEQGNLVYWVGQTSGPIRSRIATHSREFLAGTYNVLDADDLTATRRTVVWKGLWWRKSSADRYEEYLVRAGEIAPLTLAQLRGTRIFVIPTPKNKRLLARLEAALVNTLYADPDVGSILDRGYSLAPRRNDEEPIHVRLAGAVLRGLPGALVI